MDAHVAGFHFKPGMIVWARLGAKKNSKNVHWPAIYRDVTKQAELPEKLGPRRSKRNEIVQFFSTAKQNPDLSWGYVKAEDLKPFFRFEDEMVNRMKDQVAWKNAKDYITIEGDEDALRALEAEYWAEEESGATEMEQSEEENRKRPAPPPASPPLTKLPTPTPVERLEGGKEECRKEGKKAVKAEKPKRAPVREEDVLPLGLVGDGPVLRLVHRRLRLAGFTNLTLPEQGRTEAWMRRAARTSRRLFFHGKGAGEDLERLVRIAETEGGATLIVDLTDGALAAKRKLLHEHKGNVEVFLGTVLSTGTEEEVRVLCHGKESTIADPSFAKQLAPIGRLTYVQEWRAYEQLLGSVVGLRGAIVAGLADAAKMVGPQLLRDVVEIAGFQDLVHSLTQRGGESWRRALVFQGHGGVGAFAQRLREAASVQDDTKLFQAVAKGHGSVGALAQRLREAASVQDDTKLFQAAAKIAEKKKEESGESATVLDAFFAL